MTSDKKATPQHHLDNLAQVVPLPKLAKMRKLSDLDEYLPFEAAGLTVRVDENDVRGTTAKHRGGAFVTLSNTPATQIMTRMSDPRDIARLFEESIERDYNPNLVEWEGKFNGVLKPRGGRNPLHMLEMALIGGPTGDPAKKTATPYQWDLFYQAVDRVIKRLKDSVGNQVLPKHLIPSTPASTRRVLKIAHVLKNSAGDPWFSDPDVGRTAKQYHLKSAVEYAHRFMQPGESSLPRWPSCSFARGDRAYPWLAALDDEEARDLAVHQKRDRKIDASSFVVQLMDGVFTQALAEGISLSNVPEIDMRAPDRLANHFEHGYNVVQKHGKDVFSVGRDESSWDMHFPPQLWYGCYLVYREMFPPEFDMITAFSDRALLLNSMEMSRLQARGTGVDFSHPFRYMDGTVEKVKDVDCTSTQIHTDSVLRRMFAAASGNPMRFGHIIVDGYDVLLDTPRDGKFLCGWSMRSGNFCTFLANSLGNWIKSIYLELASHDEDEKAKFAQQFGYTPPSMNLKWFVCRGDDAGDVWEITDRSQDWKISQLIADWLTFVGAKANAKKQETSDERGVWRLGFAQLYTDEEFPRGVSSMVRVLERHIWNEADEVVTVDPDSGEDLRPYLELMNTFGRTNVLWGLWGRAEHPRAREFTALLQDIDSNRMLPPLDAEERRLAERAYRLKLMRRGQLPANQLDQGIGGFWATPLSSYVQKRYDSEPRLQDHAWSPVARHPSGDAREFWRDRKNLGKTLGGIPWADYP